jgi:quercetin dioxygenase-like cupin family protein
MTATNSLANLPSDHPSVTPAAAARRTETPNAVMTTLASPTQGGAAGLSLWRVEMGAGQQGPPHVFDTEQVWSVLTGAVQIEAGADVHDLGPGDTLVLPGGVVRQVRATSDSRLVVCGHGDAEASVPGEDGSRGVPAWIA